jgi:hypothetical protein
LSGNGLLRRFDSVVLYDAPFVVQKFFDMLDEIVM